MVLPLLEISLRSAAFGYIFLDMVKIHILSCLVDRGTAGGIVALQELYLQ